MIFSSSGNLMTMDSDQKKMCRSVHLRILRLELQVKKSGKKIFSVGEGRDHIWVRTSSVTSVRLQFPRKMINLLIFRTKWKYLDDDSHYIDIVGLNNRLGGNGGENPLLRSKVVVHHFDVKFIEGVQSQTADDVKSRKWFPKYVLPYVAARLLLLTGLSLVWWWGSTHKQFSWAEWPTAPKAQMQQTRFVLSWRLSMTSACPWRRETEVLKEQRYAAPKLRLWGKAAADDELHRFFAAVCWLPAVFGKSWPAIVTTPAQTRKWTKKYKQLFSQNLFVG